MTSQEPWKAAMCDVATSLLIGNFVATEAVEKKLRARYRSLAKRPNLRGCIGRSLRQAGWQYTKKRSQPYGRMTGYVAPCQGNAEIIMEKQTTVPLPQLLDAIKAASKQRDDREVEDWKKVHAFNQELLAAIKQNNELLKQMVESTQAANQSARGGKNRIDLRPPYALVVRMLKERITEFSRYDWTTKQVVAEDAAEAFPSEKGSQDLLNNYVRRPVINQLIDEGWLEEKDKSPNSLVRVPSDKIREILTGKAA